MGHVAVIQAYPIQKFWVCVRSIPQAILFEIGERIEGGVLKNLQVGACAIAIGGGSHVAFTGHHVCYQRRTNYHPIAGDIIFGTLATTTTCLYMFSGTVDRTKNCYSKIGRSVVSVPQTLEFSRTIDGRSQFG